MNEITLKDAIQELEELSTGNWVPYEYSPEEAKLILNYINNLQSKIDKAIEFIKESNTYYEITHYIPEDEKQFKINMETLTNHLLDILKGDK